MESQAFTALSQRKRFRDNGDNAVLWGLTVTWVAAQPLNTGLK
jgi:hypothetical protein